MTKIGEERITWGWSGFLREFDIIQNLVMTMDVVEKKWGENSKSETF